MPTSDKLVTEAINRVKQILQIFVNIHLFVDILPSVTYNRLQNCSRHSQFIRTADECVATIVGQMLNANYGHQRIKLFTNSLLGKAA